MDYPTTITTPKFECIVCHLISKTLSEHHRHQTYCHTSEELSLCTIGLRSSLINQTRNTKGWTYVRSWLCDPQQLSKFYAYSAKLLNDLNNNNDDFNINRTVPVDYVLPKEDNVKEEACDSDFQPPRWVAPKNSSIKRGRLYSGVLNSGVLDLSWKIPSRDVENRAYSTPMDTLEDVYDRSVEIPRRDGKFAKKNAPADSEEVSKKKSATKKSTWKASKKKAKIVKMAPDSENRNETRRMRKRNNSESELNDQDSDKNILVIVEEAPTKRKTLNKKKTSARKCTKLSTAKKAKTIAEQDDNQDETDFESYKIDREKNYEKTKKKGSATKRKISPFKSLKNSSTVKRAKTLKIWSDSDDNQEEILQENEKFKKSEVHDNTGFYLPPNYPIIHNLPSTRNIENMENCSVHPDNEVPDVANEICIDVNASVNENNNSYVDRESLTSETFDRVENFPEYPENMDDRTILIFDPISRKLVWASLELTENSSSDNDYNDNQDYSDMIPPNYIGPKLDDYVVNMVTVPSSPLLPIKLEREDTSDHDVPESQMKTNEKTLENDENSLEIDLPIRPKRTRFTPNRFVPY